MDNAALKNRRKFVTNEPGQLKYLVSFIAAMLVPSFLVGVILYFLIFKILTEQLVTSGSSITDIYPVVMKTNLMLILIFPLLFLALFLWAAVLSHRFVGPLQRLKRQIEDMAQRGDFTARLSTRKGDEIGPFVDSINKLLDKVCELKSK